VPYRTARAEAAVDLAYIRGHLDGHPILARLISRASGHIRSLNAFYERQVARVRSGPAGLAEAQRRTVEGERRFAVFRDLADAMQRDTDAFVRDARAAQDRRTNSLTVALLLLGAAAIAVAVALSVTIPRRIARMVAELDAERAATAQAAQRAGTLQRLTAALAPSLDESAVLDVLGHEVLATAGIDEVSFGRGAPDGPWIDVRTLRDSRGDDQRRRIESDADLPLAEVMRTGEALFLASTMAALDAFPAIARHPAAGLDRSWALLPMKAGRSPLTVLALRFESPRTFSAPERTFLTTLADQCAQALERVRLHQQQVHIAHTLQQSLLPRRLPAFDGIELAARYVTAERAQEVGGDYYDVFEDGAGRLAVVVGDACGKGPEAAALTALARYTVRAVAMTGATPAETMGRLNTAIREQSLGTLFMTAAHATLVIEGDRVRVVVCRAGHPHPLIVRATGEVEEIGGTGRLLGVFDDPALVDVEAELHPGDILAVFTDGLTEARQGQAIMGEERLRRAAAGCSGLPADESADLLLRAASDFARGALRDDVAVVVVRFTAGVLAAAGAS
jgi:serine phosphatase RsbU (regulator of sigma subunit)